MSWFVRGDVGDSVSCFSKARWAFVLCAGVLKCGPDATEEHDASQPDSCLAAPSGLIAWWPADNDAADLSGEHEGILENGARFTPGLIAAGPGDAFEFDGVDDVVVVPSADELELIETEARTLELWAFRTNPNVPLHVAGKREGCNLGPFYQIAIGTDAFPSDSVPLFEWVHLAAVFDGPSRALLQYVDGRLVATSSLASGSNAADFSIGNSGTCAPFGGLIDEVALYDRALTLDEIRALARAGETGKCRPESLTHAASVARRHDL